ncbi:hypothetical protein [Methylobacterium sp. J-088]|uniref:hypothetical protein n=1 Tax=Methylobacterium sp. J-088 TaxID=2836664 RepID=UPI001FBB1FD9|nr:hypothetical protein [Methylobacterium sp. J-088]
MTDGVEAAPKAKKGRPAGKRGTFTFRVTADLRARLEADAAAVGRPVSEEIERRLERTYETEDLLLSYFGSGETVRLSQAIAHLCRAVEMNTGKRWTDDLETRSHVQTAIGRFMNIYFYEQGSEEAPSPLSILGGPRHGWNAAEQVAQYMGLRSKAREEMEAFIKTPEGQAAFERIQKEIEAEQSEAAKPKV